VAWGLLAKSQRACTAVSPRLPGFRPIHHCWHCNQPLAASTSTSTSTSLHSHSPHPICLASRPRPKSLSPGAALASHAASVDEYHWEIPVPSPSSLFIRLLIAMALAGCSTSSTPSSSPWTGRKVSALPVQEGGWMRYVCWGCAAGARQVRQLEYSPTLIDNPFYGHLHTLY
jgi:hypothetical protein